MFILAVTVHNNNVTTVRAISVSYRKNVKKKYLSVLVFQVIIMCRLVGRYRRSGGTYCLHLPEDGGSIFL
jgi:hypothetical protein